MSVREIFNLITAIQEAHLSENLLDGFNNFVGWKRLKMGPLHLYVLIYILIFERPHLIRICLAYQMLCLKWCIVWKRWEKMRLWWRFLIATVCWVYRSCSCPVPLVQPGGARVVSWGGQNVSPARIGLLFHVIALFWKGKTTEYYSSLIRMIKNQSETLNHLHL